MEPGELASAGTRTTVGVAGAGYTWLGLPLSDVVAIFTIVYLTFQIISLAPKVFEVIKRIFKKGNSDG